MMAKSLQNTRNVTLVLQEEPAHERRARLLEPGKIPPTNISVWGLIKDVVAKGGDLSRVATPVQLLEPLSELQQRCEDLEYTELLDQVWAEAKQAKHMYCMYRACSDWSHRLPRCIL